ncbi:MAG: hypothetical protein ACRETB_13825 [Steroidobacteraceae bacterium]
MPLRVAIRRPSGFLPIALSGAALGVVLLRLAIFGTAPEMHAGRPDEGPAAHLWQIFMTAQAPIILFFMVRGLRQDPAGTLSVLGVQALAILLAAAPVFLLQL